MKTNDYNYLNCPIEFDNFYSMTKSQAEEFFNWYMSIIDERINILKKYINKNHFPWNDDLSNESLSELWKWFEENMVVVDKTEEELSIEKEGLPLFVANTISNKRISSETVAYCIDISFYFAKMIKSNSSNIQWIIGKKGSDLNQPLLNGFKYKITMNPKTIIINLAKRSIDKKNSNRLLETYMFWMEKYIK